MEKYDVIIVGKGPAGISAALYTARANLKTLVIGGGNSALAKAGQIENYFGFDGPVKGEQLLKASEEQARRLGVNLLEDEVTAVEYGEEYMVKTESGSFSAPAVLIATGQASQRPVIPGIVEFEGKGVSYCTTCDGFFFRNKRVGILGNGNFAVQEAIELEPITNDITIFTNGKELSLTGEYLNKVRKYTIDTQPVIALAGDDVLKKIVLENGTNLLDGLFVAYGTASSIDFAARLGVEVSGNSVVVDGRQQTNLEGVFAAGDCTGGFKQVSAAVGQGAAAGRSIIDYIRKIKSPDMAEVV